VTVHRSLVPAQHRAPWAGDGFVRRWLSGDLRRRLSGVAISAALVFAVTGVIELLKPHIPVLSLSVLYLFAVLPVAVVWGLAYSVGVAVGSMLSFNFFFLSPLFTFTLQDSRNWFALIVFLVTAVVVSELAAGLRRRAQESALLAEIATSLLERGEVSGELDRIAADAAKALQVERAEITLGEAPAAAEGAERHPLTVGARRVGAIDLTRPRHPGAAARRRLLPALASLLGVAIDRERLAREALEAEALRRSDAMKTALLRAVSHDLRSPLMAILTSASALAQPELQIENKDRDELLATIRVEAGRLDRLVADLLDLSRLQAGAAEPQPSEWSIDDLIVQAIGELGAAADRVEVSLPQELAIVRVDAGQIERVLVNLIENALKYSPASETVRVLVSSRPSEILTRVVDHGPGVPPGEAERIFEPFQRGSGNGVGRGAGLGLAIARGFAESNGGRVWVESRAGQGATFVLALPSGERSR
jgi:two-component system sensor histidine kinase KdpD